MTCLRLLVVALLLVAPPAFAQGSLTVVGLTLKEGRLEGGSPVVEPGASVTFSIRNEDAAEHAFAIQEAPVPCGPPGKILATVSLPASATTKLSYTQPPRTGPAPSILVDGATVGYVDYPASDAPQGGTLTIQCARPFSPVPGVGMLLVVGVALGVALLAGRSR